MSDLDFEVIWHEPPPSGKWGPRLERFVELLRANHDQWGELPPIKTEDGEENYPQSVLTTLKKRWGQTEFEWRSVSTKDPNKIRVFGRCKITDPELAARSGLRPVKS